MVIIGCNDDDNNPFDPYENDTTAVITGFVTDAETGDGIPNAAISSDDSQDAVSGDDGGYSLQVTEGERTITVTADGYESHSDAFEIAAGDTSTKDYNLTPIVEEPAAISGRVIDSETSEGIGSALISCDGEETTTDNDGNYSLEIPAGSYTVTASADDYESQDEDIEVTAGESYTVNFSLTPDGGDDQTGLVSGHVTDSSNGTAIGGARVACSGEETYTNADGYYELRLLAGDRLVIARAGGYTTIGEDVVVTVGGEHTLDFTLVPTGGGDQFGLVLGRVTDSSNGQPISGAQIVCDVETAYTNNNGEYSVRVLIGVHTVSASANNYQSASRNVDVIPNGSHTVNFSLTPTGGGDDYGTINGRIIDFSNQNPINAVRVECAGVVAHTNANGMYSMQVPAGSHTMNVSKAGYYPTTYNINVAADQTYTVNFSLTPGGGGGTGTITGRVIDATNQHGIYLAHIVCAGRDTYTDVAGNYGIEVPAGNHTINVDADGYSPASQNVNVQAGGSYTVNFSLQPTGGDGDGQIRGRVTSLQGGQGISGARVSSDDGNSVNTDAGGNYMFYVGAGNRTITASAAGYRSSSQQKMVVTNRSYTINFALSQ